MKSSKHINLKHLLIDQQKQIGIQFYQNQVLEAMTKELPDAKWSNTFGMFYIPNTPSNIQLIFKS